MAHGARGATEKILAFFGSDLARGRAHRFLRKAHKAGFTPLVLDSAAMALACEAEVPWRVIEDYVDPEDVSQAQAQAEEGRRTWFEAARDEFTADGVCWPELDTGAMRYVWGNATLALALARSFRSLGIRELRFFRHFSPRAQIGPGKSDICGLLWEAELPGVARPFITFEQLQAASVFDAAMRALRRLSNRMRARTVSDVQGPVLPAEGLFLVTGPNEALRFCHSLTRLSGEFPDQMAIALIGPGKYAPPETLEKNPPPVWNALPFPIESWIPSTWVRARSAFRKGLSPRFFRGYLKARAQSTGRAWQRPLEVLRDHFAYYCLYRWPSLHGRNMKFWSDLWARCRPRLILASTVEDPRFRIAIAAGRLHGIPTVGIPHGGVVGTPGYAIKPLTDSVLYSNGMQKTVFERAGFPSSRMLPCKGLVADHEYPVESGDTFETAGKLRVLALTDTTDEGTNVTKLVGLRAQYTALKALVEPPPDMADRVEVRVKVHPYFHDLAMMAVVGSEVTDKIMPLASDLNTALREADLVVAVNYYGSALIHAFRACKPVVCFLTVHEKLVTSKLNFFDLFTSGTAVAHTPDEFWKALRSFLTDPEFAQALQRRAAAFARRELGDSHYPEITEVLQNFLRGAREGMASP